VLLVGSTQASWSRAQQLLLITLQIVPAHLERDQPAQWLLDAWCACLLRTTLRLYELVRPPDDPLPFGLAGRSMTPKIFDTTMPLAFSDDQRLLAVGGPLRVSLYDPSSPSLELLAQLPLPDSPYASCSAVWPFPQTSTYWQEQRSRGGSFSTAVCRSFEPGSKLDG